MLSQFFWGGQHSLRLVWSLLVYQLPSRRFKQSWAWQLKQSSQLPGHQITDGRVGKCGCSSWANHIKKIVFKIDLAWNNKNTQPTVFFFAGEKVPCFRSSSFFGFGREWSQIVWELRFQRFGDAVFQVGKPDFIKKRERPRGGLTILEFIIPKVSDHAFNGGVASFFFRNGK